MCSCVQIKTMTVISVLINTWCELGSKKKNTWCELVKRYISRHLKKKAWLCHLNIYNIRFHGVWHYKFNLTFIFTDEKGSWMLSRNLSLYYWITSAWTSMQVPRYSGHRTVPNGATMAITLSDIFFRTLQSSYNSKIKAMKRLSMARVWQKTKLC